MSWIARSLANSLKSDDDDEEISKSTAQNSPSHRHQPPPTPPKSGEDLSPEQDSASRGVKEDLSELTRTLSRQFWGVASFLAPPPPAPSSSAPSADSNSPAFAGIRSDFAEIGGRFRSGISRLSTNRAVSEISKIATTLLPFSADDDRSDHSYDGSAAGVTKEVLAFARNISMHPETWLDFPLFLDDDESDDFDLSDAQQEHALAVERLAPRLAALRIELCPSHMSEGCFWKIYFVLLHSRLNKHDAELLSTPQIVEARGLWLQELEKLTKQEPDRKVPIHLSDEEQLAQSSSAPVTTTLDTYAHEPLKIIPIEDIKTEKHPVVSTEVKIIDKSLVEEPIIQTTDNKSSLGSSKTSYDKDEEEADDWLENTGTVGDTGPLGNEEDVSFSDLEDDDDRSVRTGSKTVTDVSDSSTKDSRGWVQLSTNPGESADEGHAGSTGHHRAETKESSDWLSLDDLDTD